MTVTVFIRYQLDPFKRDAFETYATNWLDIIPKNGGDLVGYCIAMSGVGEMHLLNITIAPAARRRGHARRIVTELVRVCRSRRESRLWLEVRESNDEAREVYRRLGFAAVGRRKGYYPAPAGRREDAIVMSLDVMRDDIDALD